MSGKRLLSAVCGALICALALAGTAQAATFNVDDSGDSGDFAVDGVCDTTAAGPPVTCTLRAALDEANANTGDLDNVTFATGLGVITPSAMFLTTGPVTIDGNGTSGAGATLIDGGDTTKLFLVANLPGTTTFKDMRLENGLATGGGGGAGGIETGATTALVNVVLAFHQGTTSAGSIFGGALNNSNSSATLSVTDSQISGNTLTTVAGFGARGAGLSSAGPLLLTNSTVSGNSIVGAGGTFATGGGIAPLAAFTVNGSTISGNTVSGAGAEGGGFWNGTNAGSRLIANSTISTNTAPSTGAGGAHLPSGTVTNVTFAANSGGSGGAGSDLIATVGSVTARNTIFGSTTGCATAGGTIDSAIPGNNIDTGTSCGFSAAQGNLNNTNPLLLSLGPNGGTTQTHPIGPSSPALNAAEASCGGLSTDQRGVLRPQGTLCDIGAFELEFRVLTVTPAGSGSGTVSGTGIACGVDCTESVAEGTVVTLTAAPGAGSSFTSWSGCDNPTGNTCAQTLGGNETVTATFTADPVIDPPVLDQPVNTQPITNPPVVTPTPPKRCKKGQKLKKGRCVKKKKRKEK